MLSQEYYTYVNNWNFFTSVWAYDYTVSTLNAGSIKQLPYYEFSTNAARMSYIQGQASITSQYPKAANAGQFNTIR
jgi:hypothetical protein